MIQVWQFFDTVQWTVSTHCPPRYHQVSLPADVLLSCLSVCLYVCHTLFVTPAFSSQVQTCLTGRGASLAEAVNTVERKISTSLIMFLLKQNTLLPTSCLTASKFSFLSAHWLLGLVSTNNGWPTCADVSAVEDATSSLRLGEPNPKIGGCFAVGAMRRTGDGG